MKKYSTPKEISDNSDTIINEIFNLLRKELETEFTVKSQNKSTTVNFKNLLIAYFKSDIFKSFDKGTYYTSYSDDINISQRKYMWVSSDIGQSITYPFEQFNISPREYLNPHMFKVDINKNHNLLVSNNIVNSNIFNLALTKYFRFVPSFYEIFRTINRSLFDKILDFKFEANLKILLFIEAFNKIIELINKENSETNELNYIDGYKNAFDQNEIAFCNFTSFIPKTTITKYRITKIENKENPDINNISFPFKNQISDKMCSVINKTIGKVLYRYNKSEDIIKVYCDKNINIYYETINSREKYVYNCTDNYNEMLDMTPNTIGLQNNKHQLENVLYNKYIKYKLKYIKLKEKLSL